MYLLVMCEEIDHDALERENAAAVNRRVPSTPSATSMK